MGRRVKRVRHQAHKRSAIFAAVPCEHIRTAAGRSQGKCLIIVDSRLGQYSEGKWSQRLQQSLAKFETDVKRTLSSSNRRDLIRQLSAVARLLGAGQKFK